MVVKKPGGADRRLGKNLREHGRVVQREGSQGPGKRQRRKAKTHKRFASASRAPKGENRGPAVPDRDCRPL